jgi:hypothetical protein
MTELEVCLEFACTCCCRPVELVVRCEGPVLALTTKVLADVTIDCPNCGEPIDVTFDPEGAVYAVAPHEAPRIPVPSLN